MDTKELRQRWKVQNKYLIRGISETNKLIELNPMARILVISLGNSRTKLPESREKIIEVDLMMEDVNNIGVLFAYKIKLIKHLLENSDEFDLVIIRCDAGASRSQAIGTLFNRHLGINFDRNIHIGNHAILTNGDNVLRKEKYGSLFKNVFIEPYTWYWDGKEWTWNYRSTGLDLDWLKQEIG